MARIQWATALASTLATILAVSAASAAGAKPPAPSSTYRRDNVTYDLSHVHDGALSTQILTALALGYDRASAGRPDVRREIASLRGDGGARLVSFFSDAAEADPSAPSVGAPAFSIWQGPRGPQDMDSAPSTRTDLRVFIAPNQPYWYVTSNLWHELLHLTLRITHHQTTAEGTFPAQYVNDTVWYSTIKKIMFDFPRTSPDPISGGETELYDPEDNPWS